MAVQVNPNNTDRSDTPPKDRNMTKLRSTNSSGVSAAKAITPQETKQEGGRYLSIL